MEEKSKKVSNKNLIKTVKILTIVFLIILVSMISFFGIYVQNKNQVSNKVKDYTYGMDINGARTIKLKVSSSTKEIVKDSEGKIIEQATDEEIKEKGYIKEEVPNNSEEIKTEENYNKTKNIIEKRLKSLGVQNYNISLNSKTGEMVVEIPEDSNTDSVVANLTTMGKFELIDSQTKEVLLDNSTIKSSDVLYNTTSTGTAVYLEIAFNKEGKTKLEEISRTYIKTGESNTTTENTTNETTENSNENETTEKKVTMKIDDQEIMSTSFDEPLTMGKIQLSIGTATTNSSTLQDYIVQAQSVATVLDNGNLPIKYDIEKNQYILSDITDKELGCIVMVILIIVLVAIIVLIAKFKLNGLLSGLAYIGFIALFVLLLRYANVIISIESIFGIISMLILNYVFTFILLSIIKNNIKNDNIVNKSIIETYTKFFNRIIPICIMVIAFCFVKWIPISSFGMISFWGLSLIAVYNAVITRSLLKIEVEDK